MKKHFKVSVIIPAFNEEENLDKLLDKVVEVVGVYPDYEIIVIDDGSQDGSVALLQHRHEDNPKINFISFSRNFGHQSAIRAGLDHATGDCVISMDADFQHPPTLIPTLIQKWQEGFEIVQTVRREDPSLSWFKRKTSHGFYSLLNGLSSIKIHPGAADFRLLDKCVVEALKNIGEYHLFLRGLVVWVGFRCHNLEYQPDKRFAGKTKYSFRRMFALALAGITSFSVKPLHISIFLGVLCAFLAFIYSIFALLIRIYTDRAIPGWTSVLISILVIGGMQLIVLGIIGEYLGKLIMENKRRPHYIVRQDSIDEKQMSLEHDHD